MKELMFNNGSGSVFSIIEIKPIVSIFKLKQEYIATFKYGKNIDELEYLSFKSLSVNNLIKKCSSFLGCQIKENQLLIK